MKVVVGMFERVWSGAKCGYDETQWELALDFDQESGLFRCSGSVNGEAIESHECADPVIAGFMEGRGKIGSEIGGMPLIPAAPLEMQGRFAPFFSPDQIVSGTWRSPKDWPEERKEKTVQELSFRNYSILPPTGEVKPFRLDIINQLADKECPRLLNGMYGKPSKWPRRAFDLMLGYPREILPENEYKDPCFTGQKNPPEFSAAVVRAGSEWKGEELGYRGAVFALLEKAKSEGLIIDRDWKDYFGIIPSVDATRFASELSEGGAVTLSLAASFSPFSESTLELGDVRVNLESARKYRYQLGCVEHWHGPFDGHALGKLPLSELLDYIKQSPGGPLYASWSRADSFLDGEYGVDVDDKTDRVLISAKVTDRNSYMENLRLRHEERAWDVVSWSKSESAYHVELWQSSEVFDDCFNTAVDGLRVSAQACKKQDSTFDSYPSQFIPDMRTMPMVMDGSEPATFVNASYAYDPDRLLKGHTSKDAQDKTVPGTKVLEDTLEKLNTKTKVNRKQGAGGRGQHA